MVRKTTVTREQKQESSRKKESLVIERIQGIYLTFPISLLNNKNTRKKKLGLLNRILKKRGKDNDGRNIK